MNKQLLTNTDVRIWREMNKSFDLKTRESMDAMKSFKHRELETLTVRPSLYVKKLDNLYRGTTTYSAMMSPKNYSPSPDSPKSSCSARSRSSSRGLHSSRPISTPNSPLSPKRPVAPLRRPSTATSVKSSGATGHKQPPQLQIQHSSKASIIRREKPNSNRHHTPSPVTTKRPQLERRSMSTNNANFRRVWESPSVSDSEDDSDMYTSPRLNTSLPSTRRGWYPHSDPRTPPAVSVFESNGFKLTPVMKREFYDVCGVTLC
jgi:hypothetical protein